jgi:tetratricopeptide (TPR) repeat protein
VAEHPAPFDSAFKDFCYDIGEAIEKTGYLRLAIDWYKYLLKRDPNCLYALLCIGDIYFDGKGYASAAPFFEKFARATTSAARTWSFAGGCYYNLQQYPRAVAAFESAILSGPKEDVWWEIYGWSLYYVHNYAKVVSAWKIALGAPLQYTSTRVYLADAQYRVGKVREAVDTLHRCLERYPHYGFAWHTLGRIYHLQNVTCSAIFCTEKAANFGYQPASKALHELYDLQYRGTCRGRYEHAGAPYNRRKHWGSARAQRRGYLRKGAYLPPPAPKVDYFLEVGTKDAKSNRHHHGTRTNEAYRRLARLKKKQLNLS